MTLKFELRKPNVRGFKLSAVRQGGSFWQIVYISPEGFYLSHVAEIVAMRYKGLAVTEGAWGTIVDTEELPIESQ